MWKIIVLQNLPWGGDQKKYECLGGLKNLLPQIFTWGAYYISCQKDFAKYDFEGSVSNGGLF